MAPGLRGGRDPVVPPDLFGARVAGRADEQSCASRRRRRLLLGRLGRAALRRRLAHELTPVLVPLAAHRYRIDLNDSIVASGNTNVTSRCSPAPRYTVWLRVHVPPCMKVAVTRAGPMPPSLRTGH